MIIYQRPNALILTAIVLTVLAWLPKSLEIGRPLIAASIVAWSAWGYDELRYGVNWVRRAFGVCALLTVLMTTITLR